jgi:hypothetical protein
MSNVIGTLLLVMAIPAVAAAQHSHGYGFVAPGGASCCGHTSATLHVGGGGEGILGKGIGIGAEIGALGDTRSFEYSAIGVFSANGYYHFVHGTDIKLDPFFTGGYTLIFRSGYASLFNFGGGINYWFHRRWVCGSKCGIMCTRVKATPCITGG